MEGIVILVTTSSKAEAEKIGDALVAENLVACVNIMEGVQSIFRWQAKLCRESEILMILKTVKPRLDAVVHRIKELHSYEVPEIIGLPIVGGSQDYLDWVREETFATQRA
ncbi:divalent-cation tolerance protein CutA [bacterium]|nr:divalent-cation tolerance protein CutA [bacterium]